MDIDWIGKDYSLQPHKKFQRGTVWVSDDEVRRTPKKRRAPVSRGACDF
jgi:hypothetical protein